MSGVKRRDVSTLVCRERKERDNDLSEIHRISIHFSLPCDARRQVPSNTTTADDDDVIIVTSSSRHHHRDDKLDTS